MNICNIDLNRDTILLFSARFTRLFSYGMISIVLTLYLISIDYNQWEIGSLFTIILFGNVFITLLLTTIADSIGRRNILIISSLLKIFAGIMFAYAYRYIFLILGGIIGIMSPTGGEIGPFLAVEQACLTETMKDKVKIA
jgi:MFS family permease